MGDCPLIGDVALGEGVEGDEHKQYEVNEQYGDGKPKGGIFQKMRPLYVLI